MDELSFLKALRARANSTGHAGNLMPLTGGPARLSERPTNGSVRLGIGDDCAVLRPPVGCDVVVTTDFSLEGRHFRRDWHSGTSAGHRCLARGLSDLAAMGARPMAAFLSLALPAGYTKSSKNRAWLDDFLGGMLQLSMAVNAPLAGGDTSTAPGDKVFADIVLTGYVKRGKEMRRSGARPGNWIYITGGLGGAAAELQALQAFPRRFLRATAAENHPHLFPIARLKAGERIREFATAALDVSDGLSTDLHHLCEESGVGAVVDESSLPLHSLLDDMPWNEALEKVLHGGEDYELLFTTPTNAKVPRRVAGVPVTRIGEITQEKAVFLRTSTGKRRLKAAGWEHVL